MNKKGFLLVDALINIIIVSSVALLSIAIFKQLDNYYIAFEEYINSSNEQYDYLFLRNSECDACQVTDLSNQDS